MMKKIFEKLKTLYFYFIINCKKFNEWMKPKCPNCKKTLTKTVWVNNTVELDCEVCKYHQEYNDSYP